MSKSALLLSPCLTWAHSSSRWYDEEKVDRTDTEKRDRGTAVHNSLDEHNKKLVITRSGLWDSLSEKLYQHASRYLDQVIAPRCFSIKSEVCVGVNWRTGEAKIFWDVVERKYPSIQGWQFGTADLFCTMHDGSILIADWKTGGTEGAEEQLLSLATAFGLALGYNENSAHIYTSCLQVSENGVWPHETDVTDMLASHALAMELQTDELIKKGVKVPVSGIHCTTLYCPHLAYCGAITGIVCDSSELDRSGQEPIPVSRLVSGMRMTDKPCSDQEAGYVMSRITAAKRQMKYWEECLKDYVTKHNGKVTAGSHEWGPGNNGWRWRKQ